MYYQGMDDFVFEVVVDICSRTFKLKSDDGNNKIIACDDTDEFMRVLEVCDIGLKITWRPESMVNLSEVKFVNTLKLLAA